MITISAFKDREEALISKALLEAAGVPVTLKDDFGELQLQVRETDAHLAQEVLDADEPAGWRARMPRATIPLYRGGKRRVGREFLKGGALTVLGFLFLLLLLAPFGGGREATPFSIGFLFIFGGCVSLIVKFFRIRRRSVPTRRLRL